MLTFIIITAACSLGLNVYFVFFALPRNYNHNERLKGIILFQELKLSAMHEKMLIQVSRCNAVIKQFIDQTKKTNHANTDEAITINRKKTT